MSKIFKYDTGKKFLFFTNYKVMNSNLVKILNENYTGIRVYTSIDRINEFEGYIKLAIVRNPYDRLLSLFFDKCREHPKTVRYRKDKIYLQKNQAQILSAYAELTGKEIEIVESEKDIALHSPLYQKFLENLVALESIDFPQFVDITALIFDLADRDAHFAPQSTIMTRNNFLVIDRYFKLENIKEGWEEICNILGAKLELRHGNRTNFEGPDKYKRFYSDKMKNKVCDFYRMDFENFRYMD